jgi:hypothetical protein
VAGPETYKSKGAKAQCLERLKNDFIFYYNYLFFFDEVYKKLWAIVATQF